MALSPFLSRLFFKQPKNSHNRKKEGEKNSGRMKLQRPFPHVADPDKRGGRMVKIEVATRERDDFEKWFHRLDDLAGRELRGAFAVTPIFILVADKRQPLAVVC